jgi:hypothetical protein
MKRLTPLKAIRLNCISCSAGYLEEVRNCHVTNCDLWPYRMGKRPPKGTTDVTPLKAIRKWYLDQNLGSYKEIRDHPIGWPCDPFRFGKYPEDLSELDYFDGCEEAWFPWKLEEREQAESNTAENEKNREVAASFEENSGAQVATGTNPPPSQNSVESGRKLEQPTRSGSVTRSSCARESTHRRKSSARPERPARPAKIERVSGKRGRPSSGRKKS